MMRWLWGIAIVGGLMLSACAQAVEPEEIQVSLISDGRERIFSYTTPVTVGEFLQDAEIEMEELDRVNPQPFTQISNGMIVTVVRVQEETQCEEQEVPFQTRTVPNEGLSPGDERLGQAGQNGVERICYRVRVENDVPLEPVEISRVEIEAPQDEVIYIGPSGEVDPVPIDGTLAYINNQNAWIIRESSLSKRPLTTDGNLDEVVFDLSEDGRKLLFSGEAETEQTGFSNELWVINDVFSGNDSPTQLIPENVLQAHWIPGQTNTISYSLAEPSETAPGWRALNDLWSMRFDPETGESLRIEEIVPASSFGLYSWWGTRFSWSPDGTQLAWVRADSMGLVDLETANFNSLVEYPVFNTRQSWSWRATVSWAEDSELIATTVHVPIGNYPPETSPAFSVAVASTDGLFDTPIADNTGIWSAPKFSPVQTRSGNQFPTGHLAYLKSRDPFNSINGDYDLVVADRDGSNARMVFPEAGQPGLSAQEFEWSPDGNQIALIYQGNLWVVDIETLAAHQLTLDGGASNPVWAP